jgi:hypothetical protein
MYFFPNDIVYDIISSHVSELMQLRTAAADWFTGFDNPNDPALNGQKSKDKDAKIQLPVRNVPPSFTQLELVRNMIFGISLKKKDISSKYHKTLDDFYGRSFFYPYLLNLPGMERSRDE